MKEIGLVLEGGGMRGFFTSGVLDAFIDHNFYTDGVFGVSAGACNACSYISKQKGRNFRINTEYRKRREYMSVYSLIHTGDIFDADFVYDKIPNELDPFDYETFCESKIPLYSVCSDVITGEAKYFKCIDLRQKEEMMSIRASASLPLLSRIVRIGRGRYLDGGITDSIPIFKARELGYKKNIVVLTREESYEKEPSKMMPILRKKYQEYPLLLDKMEKRHILYNDTLKALKEMENKGEVLIIRPHTKMKIGRLENNVKKLQSFYEEGYKEATKSMELIKAFVNR